jgi:hypothetical protein
MSQTGQTVSPSPTVGSCIAHLQDKVISLEAELRNETPKQSIKFPTLAIDHHDIDIRGIRIFPVYDFEYNVETNEFFEIVGNKIIIKRSGYYDVTVDILSNDEVKARVDLVSRDNRGFNVRHMETFENNIGWRSYEFVVFQEGELVHLEVCDLCGFHAEDIHFAVKWVNLLIG